MLWFSAVSALQKHISYLASKLGRQDFFLVGGCVRDIVLWLTDDPRDIDLTLAGDPKSIYNAIEKKDLSHFMTEKFGTMTLIPKDKKMLWVQYEITPLRTEWWYDDYRHPGEIQWSKNILDDAKRRDFTINCLYYFSTNTSAVLDKSLANKEHRAYSDELLLKQLKNEWIAYIASENLIIVQKHTLIAQFWVDGVWDMHAFLAYSDFIKEGFVVPSFWAKWNEAKNPGNKKQDPSPAQAGSGWQSLQFIIDPYEWIQDLINRKLKAVGNPDDRFNEDALRIIRAVRFVNVVNQKLLTRHCEEQSDEAIQNNTPGSPRLTARDDGFKIKTFDFDGATWLGLKKNFFLLQFVAKERIKEEICKVFTHGNPFGFIALLDELNVLKFLFPSLYAIKWINQPIRYHPFDVYAHTLLTLKSLQEINTDYLTRFGMLYHDVGKADQYYMHELPLDRDEVRKVFGTWLNHHTSGMDHVQKDFWALWFSSKEIDTIAWYVQNHSKPGDILMAPADKREKKLRDMLSESGYERVKNVLDITIGDRRWQMNPLQNSSDISDVDVLKDMLERLNTQEGQFTTKQLKINGNDLMKELKLKPGKKLGELLDAVFVWVRDDIKARNTKAKILAYVKKLVE